jgi:hypothetical protein
MALRVGDLRQPKKPTRIGNRKSHFDRRERKDHYLFPAGYETDLLQQLFRIRTHRFYTIRSLSLRVQASVSEGQRRQMIAIRLV